MQEGRMMRARRGFTLVELSLAMVFIGILSIAIVLIIGNTVSSYRRGILLSQVNSVGMSLVDDMRVVARASTKLPKKVRVMGRISTVDSGEVPIYGAYCTGEFSYVWNSGYLLDGKAKSDSDPNPLLLNSEKFAFVKIKNEDGSGYDKICREVESRGAASGVNLEVEEKDIDAVLIAYNESSRSGLALYDLWLEPEVPTIVDANVFYITHFTLGSIDSNAIVSVSESSCKPPSEDESVAAHLEYCAINQFSFAVQARGVTQE